MQPTTSPLLPSKYSKYNALPTASDIIIPDRPVVSPVISSSTSVPHPAGIVAPVSEKARTKSPDACIKNPAAPASPPEALVGVAPSTLNWKPPISYRDLYKTEPSDVRCR